ncbi:hypothetical protein DS830_07515 [Bombilactobacillus bombi]|nr:hypothetical protein DS830_07515 [Bombilactobacillus bombi]
MAIVWNKKEVAIMKLITKYRIFLSFVLLIMIFINYKYFNSNLPFAILIILLVIIGITFINKQK